MTDCEEKKSKQTSISSEDESHGKEHKYEVQPAALSTTQRHSDREEDYPCRLSGSPSDNICSQFFMSDPSVSEDGDESSARVIRASNRSQLSGRRMQFSLDNDARVRSARAPMIPTSPGSTSLSSWDTASPATKKMYLFHSFPDRSESSQPHEELVASNRSNNSGVGFRLHNRSDLSNNSGYAATFSRRRRNQGIRHAPCDGSCRSYANQATSQASSETRYRVLDVPGCEFSLDGSQQEKGTEQALLTPIGNASPLYRAMTKESHPSLLIGAAERSLSSRCVSRMSGPALLDDTRIAINESSPPGMDDSIAMTLSDDSDPQEVHHRRLPSSMPVRCEPNHNLADDERTAVLPPRTKRRAAPTAQSHKRSRSGDTAAAKLTTGTSWKGMERDRLPLPSMADDDEDLKEEGADGFVLTRPRTHLPVVSRVQGYLPCDFYARSRFPSVFNPPVASALRGKSQPPPKVPAVSAAGALAEVSSLYSSQHSEELTGLPINYNAISFMGEGTRNHFDTSEGNTSETKQGKGIGHNVRLHQRDEAGPNPSLRTGDSRIGSDTGGVDAQLLNQSGSGLPDSPFANFGKNSAEKAPRWRFLPSSVVTDGEEDTHKFYTCPRCRTRQREFFTVSSAPSQDSGPSSYLALYFALYVTASLFIFGLEEGWNPLDCIYFAVITLTTCGLGDLVPTTPANKLICSLFIYFGVACIGLLLGTYIAGLLDDKASLDRKSKQMESCPYCKQVQTLKGAASRRLSRRQGRVDGSPDMRFMSERSSLSVTSRGDVQADKTSRARNFFREGSVRDKNGFELRSPRERGDLEATTTIPRRPPHSTSNQSQSLLSPVTRRILGRQGHTRHESIDLTAKARALPAPTRSDPPNKTNRTPVSEATPLFASSTTSSFGRQAVSMGNSRSYETDESGSLSEGSDSSESTVFDIMDDQTFRMRAAKYVFLTIRQALVNSLVIIAFGCLGFWFIEGFPVIDSWYFTTVLLTTTGYGDVTPYTRGGKLFATIYILVAGTILLNNMSMISMIPLELRRRRIERAVLTQFGNQLDDAALRELATGPTIQRLHLSTNRPDGLNECTREMFSLAMLVRLGKVTEDDIKETFAAFRRLDVNDEGVLNSKSIIAAMIHRRRSRHETGFREKKGSSRAAPPPPPPSRPRESLRATTKGVEPYYPAAFP